MSKHKDEHSKLDSDIWALERDCAALQSQVSCGVNTGHNFAYQRVEPVLTIVSRCSGCGIERRKSLEQLTAKQRAALQALGVIKEAKE